MKKKICFVTGSRAEYGLLKNLMQLFRDDKKFELQITVTGMHLSPEFGLTYKIIEKDGFKIDEKVEILLSSDTPSSISKSMGLGLIGFANAFDKLKPELLVILGDRFEILSAAIAAHNNHIPIAHLHGGESTFGSVDEAFRHSITKMSHLHFTSTEDYRKRVIQLGEHPNRVFKVGAVGIDDMVSTKLLSKKELANEGIYLKKNNLLVVYHPETVHKTNTEKLFNNLLQELNLLKDTKLVFIYANADPNGRVINNLIDKFVETHPDTSIKFKSIERKIYLSLLNNVDAIVGNSSSGIIEAATFRKPALNIGIRQKGRIKGFNVIDCTYDRQSIKNGLDKICYKSFILKLKKLKNPYGNGNASSKIFAIIKNNFNKNILLKEFYDLKHKN